MIIFSIYINFHFYWGCSANDTSRMADDKTSEKVEMGNSSGDYYPCDLLFHPIQLDFHSSSGIRSVSVMIEDDQFGEIQTAADHEKLHACYRISGEWGNREGFGVYSAGIQRRGASRK